MGEISLPLERPSFQALEVRDLRYAVCLGVSEEERSCRQNICVTIRFRFSSSPTGLVSDEIRDTICYAELNSALERHLAKIEFKLIERLGGEIYLIARELSRGLAEVTVSVHKLQPPVKNLLGGAIYTCGDFGP
jgi:dihydroneopterin aldolase